MIDLKRLREDPTPFVEGAAAKGINVDVARLVEVDARRREVMHRQESLRAEQKKLGRETGPQIGRLKGQLADGEGEAQAALQAQVAELEAKPAALKARIRDLDAELAALDPEWHDLWLRIPQPPDPDVPRGDSPDHNVELRRWCPDDLDPAQSFEACRGFAPRTHVELGEALGLVDFARGVKLAGTRHYVLRGDGMRLHLAVLRMAWDLVTREHGFTPISVPTIVREECMLGTGFFPEGREQAYHVAETSRGAGHDLYLAGTGEVGLMGLHAGEILDADNLPLTCATWSSCFRREAGAAGRDTAGLFRVHQFDKVEQVVICPADETLERDWHERMIGIVETLLQRLELPHRLVRCCTGELGPKNADMVDVECWMPGRGPLDDDGRPTGAWGETHSASRLHDYQCRRLDLRYRDGDGTTHFAFSLNNTVAASPRLLVPLLECHQQADCTIRVPEALRPWLEGDESIG